MKTDLKHFEERLEEDLTLSKDELKSDINASFMISLFSISFRVGAVVMRSRYLIRTFISVIFRL